MASYLYITENQPFRTYEDAQKYVLKDGRWPKEIYKYDAETLEIVKILHPIRINDGYLGRYEFEDESDED